MKRLRSVIRSGLILLSSMVPTCTATMTISGCLVLSALAQSRVTGSLTGSVHDYDTAKDRQRGPLEGARMTLTNQRTGISRRITTNESGNFSFDFELPGRHTLSCECNGYENLNGTVRDIEIQLGQPTPLKFPPFKMKKIGGGQRTEPCSKTAPQITLNGDVSEPSNQTGLGNAVRARLRGDQRNWATVRPFWFFPRSWNYSFGLLSWKVGGRDSLQEPAGAQTTQPRLPVPQTGTPPPLAVITGADAVKLVNTTNATRGGIFTDFDLAALPLPGRRTFDALAFLLPGVAAPPQTVSTTVGPGIGSSVGTAGQFSANGLRSRGNNFTVDGSDNNDVDIGVRRQGFTSLVPQSIESVDQFQIATLLSEPQFGRSMAAQMNVVSGYGGERLHGTIYGFLTDQRLNARDFFDYSDAQGAISYPLTTSAGKPVELDGRPLVQPNPVGGENPFTQTQYGLVLGGPLSKKRERESFFFTSFERQAINASKESHFAIPTVDERGLNQSGGTGLGTIFDPLYPTSEIGDAFFSLFPFPNNPLGPYGRNTYTEILPASARGTVFSLRLDPQIARKVRLTARYNLTDDDTILPVTGGALFSSLRPLVRTQNFSLFSSSALSYSIANEARFSFGRTSLQFDEVPNPYLVPSKRFPGEPFLLNARFLLNNTYPGQNPRYSTRDERGQPLPDIESAALIPVGTDYPCPIPPGKDQPVCTIGPVGQVIVSGYSPIGVDVFNFPQKRTNNTYQYADTFIVNNRRHRLTGGLDIRRTQLNSNLERNFRPLVTFSGARNLSADLLSEKERAEIAALLGTSFFDNPILEGRDFMAVGSPSGFFQTQALVRDATIGLRYWQSGFFFSDQIQVVPNLALTMGVRYDYDTVPAEVNERIEETFQDPEVQKLPPLVRILDGRTQIYRRDSNNIAPYIALAWDPFGRGKTSIRAGYGIYYDQILGAVVSQSRSVFPSFVTLNFAGLGSNEEIGEGALQLSSALGFINPVDFAIPGTLNTYNTALLGTPADLIVGLDSVFSGLSAGAAGAAFTLPASDLKTPYAEHWGLTIERELKTRLVISAAYVGTRGLHLLRFATPNLGPSAIPFVNAVGVKPFGFHPVFEGYNIAPGFDPNSMTGGRPESLLGSYTSMESDATSTYHSFQFQLNQRFSRDIRFTTAYTWSHAIDEVSDLFALAGARGVVQNTFNRRAERADANFDVRHRFVYSAIWDIPVFRENRILGGWRVASIGSVQTGQPYSKYFCCDANSDGNLGDRLISAQGIVTPNAPRNFFRAPGVATVDLGLHKRFRLSQSHAIDFRTEFFNLFNRTHFGIPVNEERFPAFENPVNTRIPARTIQFALKYHF